MDVYSELARQCLAKGTKAARFISADSIVPGAGALTLAPHDPVATASWGKAKEGGPANPQDLNRYAYVLNNPVRNTDPTGHCSLALPWTVPVCAAAGPPGWAAIVIATAVTAIAAGGYVLANAAEQSSTENTNQDDRTVPGERTLSQDELDALQDVADTHDTPIDVVGSRAAGQGRNVGTDLPVGKGDNTQSDIDVRIDGQADIDSYGGLSNDLRSIQDGKVNIVSTGLPYIPSKPPVIHIRPRLPPKVV